MEKIAIIGCGGINSWVVKHIKDLFTDFDLGRELIITIYDEDIVEEKNIINNNQNFIIDDIMQNKAEVLGKRYEFNYEKVFITKENIDLLLMFDYVILGVNNHATRKIIYEFCLKNKKKLIDLKAQGTQIGYVVLQHEKGMKYYDDKYFSNPEVMERKGSCQLKTDIEKKHIENGNKIISFFGIYAVLLKLIRDEKLLNYEWKMVY